MAVDTLFDELWPGGHPKAEAALWTLISRLRRLLDRPAGARWRLVTCKPGYLVELGADHFDVTAFEAGASRARAELTAGRFEQATATLSWALALWREPALAELADTSVARAEVARLTELRHAALEDRIDAELAVGRHMQVVAELDTLVGEEPLPERRRGQLMLALYRCSREADALRATIACGNCWSRSQASEECAWPWRPVKSRVSRVPAASKNGARRCHLSEDRVAV